MVIFVLEGEEEGKKKRMGPERKGRKKKTTETGKTFSKYIENDYSCIEDT